MKLQDRVVLITGGASGMGRAAAFLMAREGARIALLDVAEEKLEQTAAAMGREGLEALPLVTDVAVAEQVRSAIQTVCEHWGRIDVVFANAGINGVWAPLDELKPEEWDETLAVNLRGTFLTVKYALPALRERGGSVVITSSVNGTRDFSNTGATAYSCSKAALVAFAKMAALELADDHVRVNVICPGSIRTDIGEHTEGRHLERVREPVEFPEGHVPLSEGRPGTAVQVAQLVLFLASDEARHISGTEVYIDGAESLLVG
jgi:NAD(P)-dependent dehydrogenase (short-subunit alcohol dehydrogenase family)